MSRTVCPSLKVLLSYFMPPWPWPFDPKIWSFHFISVPNYIVALSLVKICPALFKIMVLTIFGTHGQPKSIKLPPHYSGTLRHKANNDQCETLFTHNFTITYYNDAYIFIQMFSQIVQPTNYLPTLPCGKVISLSNKLLTSTALSL